GGRGGREAEWRALKERAGETFLRRFWLEDLRFLADTWRDGRPDATVRPNMVIAAALELSPLAREHRAEVVARSAAELLTPFGLRTLTPRHAEYQGRYEGGPVERDEAYHQGSVWPWLLGFYVEAYLRAYGAGESHRAVLRGILDGIAQFLSLQGMNQLYEVYDGDPPHRHAGCYAQAWSVAELLRAVCLVEEGLP
ncbi:MAG: glycogen debranching protein, partial [Planctomycetes bacterium]|nr:glycogen debranching protein [Planctomycetota bacterium]